MGTVLTREMALNVVYVTLSDIGEYRYIDTTSVLNRSFWLAACTIEQIKFAYIICCTQMRESDCYGSPSLYRENNKIELSNGFV